MGTASLYKNAKRMEKIIAALVEQPSVTGTGGECRMVDTMIELLKQIPYFSAHPENITRVKLARDALGREAMFALLKKDKEATDVTILLSHYDVVGVTDYGPYKEHAFQPKQLTTLLKQSNINFLDPSAQTDLFSDNYLFGRGVMDMKAGLAMQMSVLHDLSEDKAFQKNILLIATPDEENLSAGMFAAVRKLHQLKVENGWHYKACVCSEPNFAAFPGDDNKYIYTGSTGKLLPFIFCLGRETHVGQPLEGISAALMAAQLAVELEWADEFVDEWGGETSPSPTCLRIRDLKGQYDVQTPNEAYLLYNVLTLTSAPEAVVNKLVNLCRRAGGEIVQKLTVKRQMQQKTQESSGHTALTKPAVFTFSELYQLGITKYGDPFKEAIAFLLEDPVFQTKGYTEQTLEIARTVSAYFYDEAPFYFILLQPPYYPHVRLDEQQHQSLLKITAEIKALAAEAFSEDVKIKTFFPGLSDVSYCYAAGNGDIHAMLQKNMPLLQHSYDIPTKEMAQLSIPTINIGPYGKDAHKRSERLELTYSTNIAPVLLMEALKKI
ncbi:Arginine utilization protein RocB [Evansella caseinilytica]|uniref:Arginine utilization protein RocB n=1 Tax=Evansella caseinilytica TaxID=1503961 RepID=A0A1H3UQF9_9BACI|nr:M20/M25/M40 family metallo-hydrolase [Evansella caseinilytica]SDZ64663.1 Arginine utilization protein RocB [Evansella caseinilytica]